MKKMYFLCEKRKFMRFLTTVCLPIAVIGLVQLAVLGLGACCANADGSDVDAWDESVGGHRSYGEKIEYGTLTDARDGQLYKTIKIGDQTWMAENLNFAYNYPTIGLDSSSFCYDNKPGNCSKYGRLYMWSAAMDSAAVFGDAGKGCGYGLICKPSGKIRGTCPEGWHLPSRREWIDMFLAVGDTSIIGKKLKSTSGWSPDSGNGTNEVGFSMLPGGGCYMHAGSYSAEFDNIGGTAFFWVSDEYGNDGAKGWYFNSAFDFAADYSNYKHSRYSVRCVMDAD